MPRILGIDRVEFGPDKLGGLIPVGTVLGFFNHITGSHTLPASGVVLDGFMRCDGAVIPGGQKLSGNAPNLSDQRFLQGNTTSSATLQGANAATPTGTVSQPSFSGTAAARSGWFSSSNYTPGGSIGGSQGIDHTHNIAHVHQVTDKITAGTAFFMTVQDRNQTTFTFNSPPTLLSPFTRLDNAYQSGSNQSAYSPNTFNMHFYSAGVLQPPSGSDGGGASSGSMSSSTSVSGSNFSFSGSGINIASTFSAAGNYTPSGSVSQPTFSGNSFDVRPKFLDCVYLIRVN